MGAIDDISKSNSGKTSVDHHPTEQKNDGDTVSVRHSATVVNHDEGNHDTIFSKTSSDTRTGEGKHEEGGHGPNYDKSK